VLWQVGVVGDHSLARFATGPVYRQLLVEVLARDYPLDHQLIIYRTATLPIRQPQVKRLALSALPQADIGMEDTIVIPPARLPEVDCAMRARLFALDNANVIDG
jgi:hypothetical protein